MDFWDASKEINIRPTTELNHKEINALEKAELDNHSLSRKINEFKENGGNLNDKFLPSFDINNTYINYHDADEYLHILENYRKPHLIKGKFSDDIKKGRDLFYKEAKKDYNKFNSDFTNKRRSDGSRSINNNDLRVTFGDNRYIERLAKRKAQKGKAALLKITSPEDYKRYQELMGAQKNKAAAIKASQAEKMAEVEAGRRKVIGGFAGNSGMKEIPGEGKAVASRKIGFV